MAGPTRRSMAPWLMPCSSILTARYRAGFVCCTAAAAPMRLPLSPDREGGQGNRRDHARVGLVRFAARRAGGQPQRGRRGVGPAAGHPRPRPNRASLRHYEGDTMTMFEALHGWRRSSIARSSVNSEQRHQHRPSGEQFNRTEGFTGLLQRERLTGAFCGRFVGSAVVTGNLAG